MAGGFGAGFSNPDNSVILFVSPAGSKSVTEFEFWFVGVCVVSLLFCLGF